MFPRPTHPRQQGTNERGLVASATQPSRPDAADRQGVTAVAVEDRGDLYFYLLRPKICPKPGGESELALVDTAYDRVLPLSTVPHPSFRLEWTHGSFVFGRDDRDPFPDQSPLTMERYGAHVAAWRYLASFSHMPGMLKNHRKFIDLARDPALLQHVRHVPGRMHLREDLPGATCLWFRALVFVALQDDDAANELVARLVDEPLPGGLAPVRTTLVRYLEASDRPVLATAVGG